MPHPFFAPGKKDARRARSLDRLATDDRLFRIVARAACDRGDPDFLLRTVDYITRKRLMIRAGYFEQRYGRPFYAPGVDPIERNRERTMAYIGADA